MSEKKGKGVSRRDFIKIAGAGGIAAGSLGPAFLFPERAAAQRQRSHVLAGILGGKLLYASLSPLDGSVAVRLACGNRALDRDSGLALRLASAAPDPQRRFRAHT